VFPARDTRPTCYVRFLRRENVRAFLRCRCGDAPSTADNGIAHMNDAAFIKGGTNIRYLRKKLGL